MRSPARSPLRSPKRKDKKPEPSPTRQKGSSLSPKKGSRAPKRQPGPSNADPWKSRRTLRRQEVDELYGKLGAPTVRSNGPRDHHDPASRGSKAQPVKPRQTKDAYQPLRRRAKRYGSPRGQSLEDMVGATKRRQGLQR